MISDVSFGYLMFHAVLTVPVILIMTYLQSDLGETRNKRRWKSFVILVAIAYVYTIPWDNLMIEFDTWWYGDVVWKKIWNAPIGEYLFFGIQTIIMGLYLYMVDFDPRPRDSDLRIKPRLVGATICMAVSVVCLYFVFFGGERFFYASSVIAWTGPVIAIQWMVGGSYILRNWKKLTLSLIPPTLYMWIIDAYAITAGLWTISGDKTVGIYVGSLPVEEMIFFLSANIMTVFGMVLYEWVLEVWSRGNGVFIQTNDDQVCRLYHIFE